MSHPNVCICALPLLLLPFLSHSSYAQLNDSTKKNDQAIYTSLSGETLYLPEGGSSKKMLVLTRSSRRRDILQAIQDHMVINVPSQEIIDSINEAFTRANSNEGKEQEFFVGKKGRISIIVQGSWDAVTPKDNIPARVDLNAKEDEPAYDVHTHGDSVLARTGTFEPGPSYSDTVARNFRDRQQASMILSYETEREPMITTPQGLNVSIPMRVERRITFYYKTVNPIKISFSEFIDAVKKSARTN